MKKIKPTNWNHKITALLLYFYCYIFVKQNMFEVITEQGAWVVVLTFSFPRPCEIIISAWNKNFHSVNDVVSNIDLGLS